MVREVNKEKVLREIYRNYAQFREYVRNTGKDILEYNGITISFFDLDKDIDKLSPRKRQAFLLNIIQDIKQREVAEMMGITTVSVGQYAAAAIKQLSESYFQGEHE